MVTANAPNKDRPAGNAGQSALTPANLDNILLQLATRIDGLVNEEAAALLTGSTDVIDQFITRKNHLALEVSRLEKHLGSHTPNAEVRMKLAETVRELSRNAAQLRRHIEAVEEIVTVLVDVHRSYTSDGTYSAAAPLGARVR